jgi:hypothetical protein
LTFPGLTTPSLPEAETTTNYLALLLSLAKDLNKYKEGKKYQMVK